MAAPYETDERLQSPLSLRRAASHFSGSRLAPLVLFSDPKRTPDLLALAKRLPPGSALIYRHFGKPGLEGALREATQARGVQFLIGADPELAMACAADGVHFPRAASSEDLRHWRDRRPDWIVSTAAAKPGPDQRDLKGVDALFISSVFASRSPSAGTPIGPEALRERTRTAPCPVFALGGIAPTTVRSLIGTGIAGFGAIGALAEELRADPMTQTTQTASPIEARPGGHVTISKEEGGEMIVFTADVAGSSATGELTLRRVADGVWNANHTGVPGEIGGRGVGKALVQAMTEDARLSGYRVVPGCPFVAKLFERYPDWAKGVAA
jgi:thiamine-phosphate pyrophosphorylase